MLQIITLAPNKETAFGLLNISEADIIAVGYEKFSDKINCLLSLNEIQDLHIRAHKKDKKIYVYLDAFIYEQDLLDLEDLLIQLDKIKIDGIIFNDLSINQVCYERKLSINLIYWPQSLITNHGQFAFYRENQISSIVLANELRMNEIFECLNNKNGLSIIKQVSGYVFMMQSRWDLISNFASKNSIKIDLNDNSFLIKEEKREFPALIYQNKYGTHIYTNYVLSNLKYIDSYIENQLDFILIDGLFHDNVWTINTTKLYKQAIEHLKPIDELLKLEKQINHNEILSEGFMSESYADLMYLIEEEIKGVKND